MRKYINESIKDYLSDLSARVPAPGGGACAALSLSMSAALAVKACNFTIGKEKYKKYENKLNNILNRALAIQKRAAELLDEDVAAYSSKNLEKSIDVPGEICILAYELMKFSLELMRSGNKNLISDTVLSVFLAEISFTAGMFYVEVNSRLIEKDKGKYEKFSRKLKGLFKKVKQMRKKAEVKIGYSA